MPELDSSTLWIVVGLNKASCTVVFAGMSDDLTEANRIARERMNDPQGPYDVWNEIRFDQHTGHVLSKWLRANGLNKEQAIDAVRQVGAVLMECLPNYRHN